MIEEDIRNFRFGPMSYKFVSKTLRGKNQKFGKKLDLSSNDRAQLEESHRFSHLWMIILFYTFS